MGVFKRLVYNRLFSLFILGVILITTAATFFDFYPEYWPRGWGEFYQVSSELFIATQVVFTIEIALRILAYSPQHLNFFKCRRNVLDFCILLVTLAPLAATSAAPAIRLLRVIRLLRLVSIKSYLRVTFAKGWSSEMLIFFGIFFAIFAFSTIERIVFLNRSELTQARVSGIEPYTLPCSRGHIRSSAPRTLECTGFRITAEYVSSSGEKYKIQVPNGVKAPKDPIPPYSIGEEVSVIYDPTKANSAILNTFWAKWNRPISIFLCLLFLIFFDICMKGWRREENVAPTSNTIGHYFGF